MTKFKVGDRVLCGPPAHCPEDCEPYCIYSCVKPGGQESIVGTIQSPMETIVPGQIAGAEPNLQFSFTYTQKDTGRQIRKTVYIKRMLTGPVFRKSQRGDIENEVSENSLHKRRLKGAVFPKQGAMSAFRNGVKAMMGEFRKNACLLSRF